MFLKDSFDARSLTSFIGFRTMLTNQKITDERTHILQRYRLAASLFSLCKLNKNKLK